MEPGLDMGTSSDPNSHFGSTISRPQKTDHDKDSGSDSGEEDTPVSSMPSHDSKGPLAIPGSSREVSAHAENQSFQTRELGENGISDPYISQRIPSSVFASNANPMEWSTASNESLFSIYMGSTSFTGDHGMFLEKTGDTDLISEPAPANASANFLSSKPIVEHRDEDFQMNEAQAAETMKEVLKGNAEKSDSDDKVPIAEALPFGSSKESDFGGVSTQSFAFQTSTGNGNKDESPTASYKGQRKQVHAQFNQSEPETEQDSPQSEPKTLQAQFNQSQKGWFSCFSCCSSRS